jgi:hypothetical protein
LEHLANLARRRARDEKAGVRKAGIQLLEALLLMRGRGFGGIAPEEPSGTDIQAVELATADPLVHPSITAGFSLSAPVQDSRGWVVGLALSILL